MTRKLRLLILLNITLVVAIIASWQLDNQKGKTLQGLSLFAFPDTASITQISIGENTITRSGFNTWVLDQTYRVQPSQMRRLLTVLQRLETKKPIKQEEWSSLKDSLSIYGKEVNITTGKEDSKTFRIWTGEKQTLALAEDGTPYSVYVPGYVVNLADAFNPDVATWRDKHILKTSWRSIQRLSLSYPEDPQLSFTLQFDSVFLSVPGIAVLDSVAAFNYLRNFENFQAEAFLYDTGSLIDSLAKQQPFCIFQLDDLLEGRNNVLKVYPTREFFFGVLEKSQEIVRIRPEVLRTVLVSIDAFRRKEN